MNKVIIIGTGGSYKMICEIHQEFLKHKEIISIKYQNLNSLKIYNPQIPVILAIGANRNVEYRKKSLHFLNKMGFSLQSVISPKSIVSNKAKIGKGCIIMPGAIINTNSILNDNVFINTGAIVEHDCVIGESSFLATGCTLSGNVKIGNNSFIGAGSVIIGDVVIGDNVTVGAGSVVIRDLKDNTIAYGIPAHKNVKPI